MYRPILIGVVAFGALVVPVAAQQSSASSPYEGTSTPPAEDVVVTTTQQFKAAPVVPAPGSDTYQVASQQKPAAGRPYEDPVTSDEVPQSSSRRPQSGSTSTSTVDPDDDIVQAARPQSQPQSVNPTPTSPGASSPGPVLNERAYNYDPDGDIVHPNRHKAGELGVGARIQVRLMTRLSSGSSDRGESFRSRVIYDVVQDGVVLIPAGSELSGHVVDVSSGHFAGHGTMRLRPDAVVLPNGTRYHLYAELAGTQGSHTKMGSEGELKPSARTGRDTVEYGSVMGAGAVTGAVVAGPGGALVGGVVGAGVVTAHLLINHPQATLESGTMLVFTLTEPLSMTHNADNGD